MPDETRVKIRVLPGTEVAALIHRGPFATLSTAYEALLKWIEENGYLIAGSPYREIYLQPPAEEGDQQDGETITEIQFPIKKA
jgi:effector-binding domain-containing protein